MPPRLRCLPLPARLLAIAFLLTMAAGFGVAQVNVRLQHAHLDGAEGLALADIRAAFHGRPDQTALTSKTGHGGSMEKYIPRPEDRDALHGWVAVGAPEAGFEPVKVVLDRLCVRCHNPEGNMPHAPLGASRSEGSSYEAVVRFTEPDRGMSYLSLARSSHAHLFGMGVLYAVAGLIFLMTDASSRTKSLVIPLPFVAMFIDIGSWWLTKYNAAFAVGILGGGVLLAGAFAILLLKPLWELMTPETGNAA